ncbi:probable WRKY transcription factor 51 [Rhodamnia argentea]|uniref:Probable WRKY transcription factor 51 n=1 Tax=Rhodamnia argentea TaxID=178133 RepID=A0ABM3GVN8_9MYRT|nr:probable WRKY transcription factor 51 [Rhodamnia argentea]
MNSSRIKGIALVSLSLSLSLSLIFVTMNGPNDLDHSYTSFEETVDPSEFELSDDLFLEDDFEEDFSAGMTVYSNRFNHREADERRNSTIRCKRGGKNKLASGFRVAFRTNSELEAVDDGFKWRKYGKKSVKSIPKPRNYCKCLTGWCHVKKRVERDKDDSSYVITTYEGVHNHESP